ncbi:MAG: SpoIIIAH-like family protein [Eubacteriales bacterium]|nr:SpoIIIAH-like family protein [Eubacteriales bacterium]MDD4583709.1 SpoIIIAH-like family protein [Eubacteriales bacterium]
MSRFHMSRSHKKKTIVLLGMLALIVCIGVFSDKLLKKDSLNASTDYVNYEQEQMDEHDGEILVDSIHLTAIPGTAEEQQDMTESAVVITSDDLQELSNVTTYFDEIRATINMDRNEIISMLTAIIDEAKEGPEKNNATQQKLKIIEYMNAEKVMENLIENKGFTDALVIMTDSSVNVTVNKQNLSQSDVAKIMDIVLRETNRAGDQIVIQSKF